MIDAKYILFYFFIYWANTSPKSEVHAASNEGNVKSIPLVDALITRLGDERWSADDGPCLRTTLDMLRGVKNNTLWATWMWDSMQLPVGTFYGARYHIGNFDQCLQAPWSATHPHLRTQYCFADVKVEATLGTKDLDAFDSADEYLRTTTKDGRVFNEGAFGVCLPAACSPPAVARISRLLHQLTHLPGGEVSVDPGNCQKAGEEVEYSMGFYIFWSVVAILFITAVLSTLFNNDGEKHNILDTIKKSFCLKRNYNSLFKTNDGEIKVINGMRIIAASLIAVVHVAFYMAQCPFVNGLDLEKIMLHSKLGLSVVHLEVVVDTFFAISGLLLIRGLMMGRQRNIWLALVKRYIRLIGPLAFTTLLITKAFVYMGDGPFWMKANRYETEVCANSWWKNILMVNNDVETLCYIVTWYVSCDFQLSVLGTCLYCVWRRNRKWGVAAFALVAAAATVYQALVVYWYQLDMLPFNLKFFFLLRKYADLNYTYLKSYSRAGPYFVGMAMGYIMATYQPAHYRNVISKKSSLILAVASLMTMIMVLDIAMFFSGRPYDPLEVAVVVATNRVFWAAGVCCIICACEYGSLTLISNILSWSGFVPLSKLSYGLYLLHPFFIQRKMYSARSSGTYAIYSVVLDTPGVILIGYSASFIMYLVLEAPLINLSNLIGSKSSELNHKEVSLSKSETTPQNHTKSKTS